MKQILSTTLGIDPEGMESEVIMPNGAEVEQTEHETQILNENDCDWSDRYDDEDWKQNEKDLEEK